MISFILKNVQRFTTLWNLSYWDIATLCSYIQPNFTLFWPKFRLVRKCLGQIKLKPIEQLTRNSNFVWALFRRFSFEEISTFSAIIQTTKPKVSRQRIHGHNDWAPSSPALVSTSNTDRNSCEPFSFIYINIYITMFICAPSRKIKLRISSRASTNLLKLAL